jgi:hypothetical protein
MRSFYQDRLGTNIGKPQKAERFLRYSAVYGKNAEECGLVTLV